jgi:PAS domain S-box-containing protein
MKTTTTYDRLKKLAFSRPLREQDIGIEEERRRLLLAFFMLIGVTASYPFFVVHLVNGNYARSAILLFIGTFFFASLIALRHLHRITKLFRIHTAILGAYFLFLIHMGGPDGSRILWFTIFPLFAFFVLGKREGSWWVGVALAIAAVLAIDPNGVFGTFPYAAGLIVRFFVVCAILTLISYIVESAREIYQHGMEHRQSKLESEIEERLSTEKRLRESEGRYRALVENMPIPCFTFDQKGRFLSWNRASEQVYGYTEPEAVGASSYDLIVTPETREATALVIERVFSGETVTGSEWQDRDKDGIKGWRMGNTFPLLAADGSVQCGVNLNIDITERKQAEVELAAYRDHLEQLVQERTEELRRANEQMIQEIEERRRTEQALRESEERFRELGELLPETVYEMEIGGRVTFINRGGIEKFGYTQEEWDRGLNGLDVIVPEDRQRALDVSRRVLRGEGTGINEYTAKR